MDEGALIQRVIAWMKSEGLDVGGAPVARGTSLLSFIHAERRAAVAELAETPGRRAIVMAAGEEALRLFEAGEGCVLCDYGDHDHDGGERHEDECPLRPLDERPSAPAPSAASTPTTVKREDVIREVQSMIDFGGYQVARSIVKLAAEPVETCRRIGPRGRKRPMNQAEAKRLVEAARERIARVDSTD